MKNPSLSRSSSTGAVRLLGSLLGLSATHRDHEPDAVRVVGRVTPCAPQFTSDRPDSAHVTRPTLGFMGSALAIGLALASMPSTHADSLWKDDAGRPMFADKRAAAVGDILTIVVQENNTTSKDASTKSAKKTAADMSIASFLYGPAASGLLTKGGKYPALKFDASNSFDGGGKINNSEQITARIAARVIDKLPNGNLVVEGTRQTAFSGEMQDVILRGTVRQEDVAANNTVFSYNVADATIKFISCGSVSDTQKKGWFTKFWDKVTPF